MSLSLSRLMIVTAVAVDNIATGDSVATGDDVATDSVDSAVETRTVNAISSWWQGHNVDIAVTA